MMKSRIHPRPKGRGFLRGEMVTAREVEGRLVCDVCGSHLYPGTDK